MNTKWNRNYRLVWSESSSGWVVADEKATPRGCKTLSAVGRVAAAILVAGGMMASMPEDASALTGTGTLAAVCTGTSASIVAPLTGTCKALGTDKLVLSNTGSISNFSSNPGVGSSTGVLTITSGAAGAGVTIDNSGSIQAGKKIVPIVVEQTAVSASITNRSGASILKVNPTTSNAVNDAIRINGDMASLSNSGTIRSSIDTIASPINTATTATLSVQGIAHGGMMGAMTGTLTNTSSGVIAGSVTVPASAAVNANSLKVSATAISSTNSFVNTINNAGMISATVSNAAKANTGIRASATAIRENFGTNTGGMSITNDGTITATSSNSGSIMASSGNRMFVHAYGAKIFGTAAGTLVNNGTVSASASNTGKNNGSSPSTSYLSVAGINMPVNGMLTNSNTGSIKATANMTNTGPNKVAVKAYGIAVTGSASGTLNNDGTIQASMNITHTGAKANRNKLTVDGIVMSLNPGGTLNNRGTISAAGAANVNNLAGSSPTMIAGLYIGGITGTTGVINNSGMIKASRTDGAASPAYAVYSPNTGGVGVRPIATLNNQAGGVLQGGIHLNKAGIGQDTFDLNNAGLIDIPVTTPNNTISGTYRQQAGGILRIGVFSLINTPIYPKVVADTVSFAASGAIDVNVDANATPVSGSVLTNVVVAASPLKFTSGTYTVTDNSGTIDFTASLNAAGTGIDLTVVAATGADHDLPTITRTGPAVVNVAQNTTYTDQGATATDPTDGDITASITTTGTVNTATLGSYTITYNVSDAAGNAAPAVIRTVNVIVDTKPPVITINGANPISVVQNTTFTDPGVTAIDNVDGDISANVVKGGTFVNTSTPGTYTITYDVTDASGNAATQVSRTVIVTAAPATGGGSTGGGSTGGGSTGGTTTDPYSGNSGVLPSCTSPIQTSAQGFGLIPMLMTLLAGLGLVRRRKDD